MARDNGGPAFPHRQTFAGLDHENQYPGMSLRDYFAGQALASGYARNTMPERELAEAFAGRSGITREEILAFDAFRIADAMLAERNKDNG